MTEKEKKNRTELFKLIQEHPELPIVPMVYSEIIADDYGYYIGAWGHAQVDEYIITDGRILFKSDDDVFDTLERYMSDEEFEALPEAEEECRPYYDKLPWVKAIIVNIDLPD